MNPKNFLRTIRRKEEEYKLPNREGVFLVERRKHPRVSVELPFDYSVIDDGEACRGIGVDASEGGLLGYLLEKIEIGTLLRIDMLFKNGTEMTTIKAIAKVVWSDLASKESWAEYRYGIQFLSFFKGDLHRLKILLKEVGHPRGR
jgi:c-di-GMP-binding flagellar brake protein YcgR